MSTISGSLASSSITSVFTTACSADPQLAGETRRSAAILVAIEVLAERHLMATEPRGRRGLRDVAALAHASPRRRRSSAGVVPSARSARSVAAPSRFGEAPAGGVGDEAVVTVGRGRGGRATPAARGGAGSRTRDRRRGSPSSRLAGRRRGRPRDGSSPARPSARGRRRRSPPAGAPDRPRPARPTPRTRADRSRRARPRGRGGGRTARRRRGVRRASRGVEIAAACPGRCCPRVRAAPSARCSISRRVQKQG